MKECYESRFEAINQSQVILEGEHPWPERKRMQQGLQRERLEGSLRDMRVHLAWILIMGLLDCLILERKTASNFHTFEE